MWCKDKFNNRTKTAGDISKNDDIISISSKNVQKIFIIFLMTSYVYIMIILSIQSFNIIWFRIAEPKQYILNYIIGCAIDFKIIIDETKAIEAVRLIYFTKRMDRRCQIERACLVTDMSRHTKLWL